MKSFNLNISGMHCISCEILIEKELKKINNIEIIKINHKTGLLELNILNNGEESKIKKEVSKILSENNFKLVNNKVKINTDNNKDTSENSDKAIGYIIASSVVILLLVLSQVFEIYKYIPENSLSYTSAILVGFIASISTCLAITGGIIMSLGRLDKSINLVDKLKTQISFHIGRILGFFIMGGILGYIGKTLNISIGSTGILTFILGFILVFIGLNILGLMPSLSKFGIHMPKTFVGRIEKLSDKKYAPIVGALTFFLPCGFTQSMQLLAVTSGDFITGGLIMALFAIGTLPVLLIVGLGSSYFKDKNKKFSLINKVIGGIIIFFGIFSISNSYNLISLPSFNNTGVENTQDIKNLEVIKLGHDGWNTVPTITKLKAGGNYKIIITPTENGAGCMSTQVIPKISKKVSYVKKGEKIEYILLNAKAGEYPIICASMGMRQGEIIIK